MHSFQREPLRPLLHVLASLLEHLLHLRDPNAEDLREDLHGSLELQDLGVHPRNLYETLYQSPLILRTPYQLKNSCHSMPIGLARISSLAGK